MKTKFFYAAALALGLSFSVSSCSNDDPTPPPTPTPEDLDYTSENANSWHNYMRVVANLLVEDATNLYTDWNSNYDNLGEGYAAIFKRHNGNGLTSAVSCIDQMTWGCWNIANEVGTAKIGDPYNLYMSGETTQALYAVESWYSWHSRDDYSNNIISIQNVYYGNINTGDNITDGVINPNSLAALLQEHNPTLHNQIVEAINAAWNAIQAIPQPFRNNINSSEAVAAMDACVALSKLWNPREAQDSQAENVYTYISENAELNTAAVLDPIINQFVDGVIMPTYLDLMNKNNALNDAIVALDESRTNENFAAAADAWLVAREPWEESEAFLFGPVDTRGLDPNMDSWPLDQNAIVNILTSGNFDDLEWVDGETEEEITAAQSVRGFHTLEYLLFKDGKARTVN